MKGFRLTMAAVVLLAGCASEPFQPRTEKGGQCQVDCLLKDQESLAIGVVPLIMRSDSRHTCMEACEKLDQLVAKGENRQ